MSGQIRHQPRRESTSEQLREAIRESGLSLYELARLSGVDHGILSRFLRGKRTITLETAEKLAGELDLVLRVNHTGSTWHNIYLNYSTQGAAEKVDGLPVELPDRKLLVHQDATQADWLRVCRTLRLERDLRRALGDKVERVWYSAGFGNPEDPGSWAIEHTLKDSPIMRRLVDCIGWLISKDEVDTIFGS